MGLSEARQSGSVEHRADRVSQWLPCGSPLSAGILWTDEEKNAWVAFWAAVRGARSFDDLEPRWQEWIEEAERRYAAERESDPRRRRLLLVALAVALPFVALLGLALFVLGLLYSGSADAADGPYGPPMPLWFAVGGAILVWAWRRTRRSYNRLWPERTFGEDFAAGAWYTVVGVVVLVVAVAIVRTAFGI